MIVKAAESDETLKTSSKYLLNKI